MKILIFDSAQGLKGGHEQNLRRDFGTLDPLGGCRMFNVKEMTSK